MENVVALIRAKMRRKSPKKVVIPKKAKKPSLLGCGRFLGLLRCGHFLGRLLGAAIHGKCVLLVIARA